MRGTIKRAVVAALPTFLAVAGWGIGASAAPVVISSYSNALVIPLYPANTQVKVDLDLNNDGVLDVEIVHDSFRLTHTNMKDSFDSVVGLNGAAILTSGGTAVALAPGQTAGPSGTYTGGGTGASMINTEYARDGSWGSAWNLSFLNDYEAIGVQIPVGGQNYYAWLGVQSKDNQTGMSGTNTLLLHGYGYETSPNTAVAAQAPEPGSLGVIAGVGAVAMLRRRRRGAMRMGPCAR